jgi:hypothetical protein
MPTYFIVYLHTVMIFILTEGNRRAQVARRFETVLYNNVHNPCFCGYVFYPQWGIFTQLLRAVPGDNYTVTVRGKGCFKDSQQSEKIISD